MSNLELININDVEYFYASELHKSDPNYFYGCANNTRNIVKKKSIKNEYIFWAYKKKGEWVTSKRTYAKAKLLLTKEWVFNNVPMFATNNKVKYDIEPAPEILELDDNEKLRDCDGNIMEIETRGERDVDKCYFKAKNIEKFFGIKDINNTLLKSTSSYKENLHYKYFTLQKNDNVMKKKVKKRLYLTYTGLIRCLYVSRNKNADKFQKWASKILFTVQMGTSEQKNELVSKLLGVIVKEVFKTSSKTILTIIFDNLRLQAELG